MRMTIPKSQGKQAYYDARKSSWGDMFPHEPKNSPQERYQPMRAKRDGGTTPTKGQDIGKRRRSHNSEQPASYDALSEDLKARRRVKRRERNHSEEAELD
jgi:ribosomal protein RSM22 (predicted rRNA methylase)